MKIPLNIHHEEHLSASVEEEKAIERDLVACRQNDWEAKARLVQRFMPLLTNLAHKRATDVPTANRYIEAGKAGLMVAVRKFRPGPDGRFPVFAVRYIEEQMDHAAKPGLLARLFGRRG